MTTDKADVIAANEAFYRAFEKKDLEAMGRVWSQGTGITCIHPGRKAIAGWQNVRNSWQRILAGSSYLEIEVEMISIEVEENLAYVVLVEKVLQIVGGRRFEAQSIATNIFRKMAQQWYLVHHHGSPLR